MGEWLQNNAPTIIGWFGGLIMFGFVFGRRFQRIESGEKSLAKALDNLADAITNLTARTNDMERRAAEFAVRLDRTETAVADIRDLARQLQAQQTLLARIEERLLMLTRPGGREG